MISDSLDSSLCVEGFLHENCKDSHGFWVPTDIDLGFISIEEDKLPFIYSNSFKSFKHLNFYTRNNHHGPLVASIKVEIVDSMKFYSILLRLVGGTLYKVVSQDSLSRLPTPVEIVNALEPKLTIKQLQRVLLPNACEYINEFDMYTINYQHKIGVLYQRKGQVTEEDILSNQTHSKDFDEFLNLLGDIVYLKDFTGFSGGLDTKYDLTGTKSVYTTFQGREIMFHVSTLLPFDDTDVQQVQRKRHIGNDIVAIVFQDEGAVYVPGILKSHFLMVIFILQHVKDAFGQTLYKISVIANKDCANFNPVLPHPPVYLSGEEFRIFLFTKLINAELSALKSPKLLHLDCRTRTQLLENLIHKFETKSFHKPETEKTLSSLDNRGYSNSLKKKINAIFSPKRGILDEVTYSDKYKRSSFPSLENNGKSFLFDPRNKLDNEYHPNKDLQLIKLTKSEPPSVKYACQHPLGDYPIVNSSVNSVISNKYVKDNKDFSQYRSFSSRNLHLSLDESSFTSIVLDSLPSETAIECKTSLGFFEFPNSDSNESKISSAKLDQGLNFETIYNQSMHDNLGSPMENDKTLNLDPIPIKLIEKNLVLPEYLSFDSFVVNSENDYVLMKQQIKNLQSLNHNLIKEKQLLKSQLLMLRQNNIELITTNEDLISKLDRKSCEIEDLKIDLQLFAYFQNN